MKSLTNFLRGVILLVALYQFFALSHVMGIVLAGTALFSFLFSLRSPLLIKPSRRADYWELSGVLLVLANASILTFFGYDRNVYDWLKLDVPMHIWGGTFVGLWAILALDGQFPSHNTLKKAIAIIGIVALIGIIWELFEWTQDHTLGPLLNLPIAQPSLNDTMGDLFNDLIGGIAIIIVWSKSSRIKTL